MKEVTLRDLQKLIDAIDKYFYKLVEEIGELAQAIRKNRRLADTNEIKGTIEEELYDVLYYTICLANMFEIDLETCGRLKEEMNASKYNRPSTFESEK